MTKSGVKPAKSDILPSRMQGVSEFAPLGRSPNVFPTTAAVPSIAVTPNEPLILEEVDYSEDSGLESDSSGLGSDSDFEDDWDDELEFY